MSETTNEIVYEIHAVYGKAFVVLRQLPPGMSPPTNKSYVDCSGSRAGAMAMIYRRFADELSKLTIVSNPPTLRIVET